LWPHARPARLRPKPVCDKHGLPPNTKKQEKNNSKPKHSFFIKNALGYILCGWLFTVTPLYFDIRSLGLPMQTTLHFLTVTIVYFALSLWIGWIPVDVTNFLLYLVIAVFVYAIGWVSFYIYFKHESKKLNQDLRKK